MNTRPTVGSSNYSPSERSSEEKIYDENYFASQCMKKLMGLNWFKEYEFFEVDTEHKTKSGTCYKSYLYIFKKNSDNFIDYMNRKPITLEDLLPIYKAKNISKPHTVLNGYRRISNNTGNYYRKYFL